MSHALRIDSLEDRRLLAVTVSINDVTILEGDSTPSFLGEFATSGFSESKTGLIFGPDSNGDGAAELYVAQRDTGSVNRFDGRTGNPLDVFVRSGSGGLTAPMGIAFGPDGNLYVADRDADRVFRYSRHDGSPLPSPGNNGATFVASGAGGMDKPIGLTFDSEALYVTSRETDEVLRFDATSGELLQRIVPDEGIGFESPHSLAFGEDANGDGVPDLYVTGTASNNVLRFDGQNGEFLDEVVSGLDGVRGIAIDELGNIYVAQRGAPDANVLRYDTAGQFLDAYAVNENSSWGITLGPDGNLYTVLHDGQGILRYGPSDPQAVFRVELSEPSRERITVDFVATDGTALAGEDFYDTRGTLIFSPGETHKTITVSVIDDTEFEPDESLFVVLSNPSGGATIADNQGQGTLKDNDDVPGDSNHDGVFNSADLVLVFQAGRYEDGIPNNATFEQGDWNGDGDFTTSDLVFAFQARTYQANAKPTTNQIAAAVDLIFRAEGAQQLVKSAFVA